MRTKSFFALPLLVLLAACGRVATEAPSAATRAAIERSEPAAVQAPVTQAAAPAPAPTQMPAPEALTDAAITNRISSALRADPAMSGADVSINTDKGVVVLSGTVKSHEQTGVASAHAQRQDGVLRVDNHLRPQYS
jgi:hyperosmotically inducible protein